MLKRILLAALVCPSWIFGQTPTPISFTLTAPGPNPVNGTVTISNGQFLNAARQPVAANSFTLPIVNGLVSTSLIPNDTGLPIGCYQVRYSLTGIQPYQRSWFVPTSVAPVGQTIEYNGVCQPNAIASLSPGQINSTGALNGYVITMTATGPAWAANSGGGGGGGIQPYTLCPSSCDTTIGPSPLTILEVNHKQGANAFPIFWDNSSPPIQVLPQVTGGSSPGDLVITYTGTLSRIEVFGGTSAGGGGAGGTSGQIQFNSLGTFGGFTVGGDCILNRPNFICSKTNGVPFATSATVDTTNAGNITIGTMSVSVGGTGTGTQFSQGSIPFAGVNGVYTQDNANFFWDATNHRLGIGTATPGYSLDINAGSIHLTNAQALNIDSLSSGTYRVLTVDNSNNIRIGGGSNSDSRIAFDVTNVIAMQIAPTGNVLVGGTSDANYRLDVQNSGSAGTLRVFDQTASTGLTRAFLRAGAAQVSSLIDLLDFQDNSGGFIAGFDYKGGLSTRDIVTSQDGSNVGSALTGAVGDGLNISSTKRICWSSTTIWYGVNDTCIARPSAGVVEINNATTGHRYSTSLQAGGALFFDNTPTTGLTQITFQAGAAQTSPGTDFWRILNNAGTLTAGIGSDGGFYVKNSGNKVAALAVGGAPGFGLALAGTGTVTWKSVGDIDSAGSWDTGLSRCSAGVVCVGNATQGDVTGTLEATTFLTATAAPATSGVVRLASTDSIQWRNAASSGNIILAKNTSDQFTISGGLVPSTAGGQTLGGALLPFSSVYVGGAATNNAQITGTMTGARVVTLPDATFTVSGATGTFCGTTTTCSATNISTTVKVVSGQVALSSGTPSTAVVASIPAFTSTTSFACTATNMTTATNNLLKVVNTSTTSITITGPDTITDVISYVCSGS